MFSYTFILIPGVSEKEPSSKNSRVRFNDTVGVPHTSTVKQEDVIINEQKIDRYFSMELM